jgi:DNA-binding response OmpR family regulator
MRILVVEDEKKIRDYLKEHLQPECYEVDVTETGEEGIKLIRLNDYDLVILDNVLPGKHGVDVCREVRAHKITVPIIILSVLSKPSDKVELLKAGADDYLSKPFSFKELLARMEALLRRPKQIQEEVLKVRDLELNIDTHVVTRAGEEIKLTRKEFMLLRYFMKNKGFVLSRSMLIDHVWDMNADPFSNTIEAHIVSLRKKIGDKKQELIQTIPARGYKIVGK